MLMPASILITFSVAFGVVFAAATVGMRTDLGFSATTTTGSGGQGLVRGNGQQSTGQLKHSYSHEATRAQHERVSRARQRRKTCGYARVAIREHARARARGRRVASRRLARTWQ